MIGRLGGHFRENVVAYLALFVALGGTAVAAAPMFTGARIQNGTLNSDDLRNRGSVNWPGPSIQGIDVEANTLDTVNLAPDAVTGGKVANDTLSGADILESSLSVPAAYAHVNLSGTLVAGGSKNVLDVTHAKPGVSAGLYCVDLAPGVSASNVVATLDRATPPSDGHQLLATTTDDFNCPPEFDGDIRIAYEDSTGAGTNHGFFILVN